MPSVTIRKYALNIMTFGRDKVIALDATPINQVTAYDPSTDNEGP